MAVIYRRTDRIKVRVGSDDNNITLSLAPLSQHQKVQIQALFIKAEASKDPSFASKAVVLAMKHSIKKIEGLVDTQGEEYKLGFENDSLDDNTVDDLMNMELSNKLMFVCSNMVNSVPKEFLDEKGQPMIDVQILESDSTKKI